MRTGDGFTTGPANYDLFSARYGNIYTARQLRQLVERAYGRFEPISRAWRRPDGMFVDPFRPNVEPEGFVSEAELEFDRRHHLSAVRRAFEEADVFVFTLGLTEAWVDRRDEAVFPLAPGVSGGEFDGDIHAFRNFGVSETTDDMRAAIASIRQENPRIKILLTVSPVPLNATFERRHVLQSTAYSKAVLRVAAQQLCDALDGVDYFPSYELITSPHCSGTYFVGDKRTIDESGVEHVMETFFSHYAPAGSSTVAAVPEPAEGRDRQERMERLVEVLCDEAAIPAPDR